MLVTIRQGAGPIGLERLEAVRLGAWAFGVDGADGGRAP
jgi:hypothetical protein